MNENEEQNQNLESYGESYFMFKKVISQIFILPLIFYILGVAFITHVSIFNQPLKSQINLYSAKKRKILFLIMIILYICHIISLLRITNLETSENTVSSSLTLIILLFYIISIMAVLITIYFIDEKNKKQIKLDKNPLVWFITLNIIYFLLDLVNEMIYGYFTILTPITFCYCVYFQIFYYKYPSDNYRIFLSKGFKYIELNEFDKELINKKLENIKINEQKYKLNNNNNRYYIPMTYVNGKCDMVGNEKSDENLTDINTVSNNNDNCKENSSKINQLINELYNPNNNSDYLKNSYEGALKIEVSFQSNFSIDYGTYYNYNQTKSNLLKNQNETAGSLKNKLSLFSSHNLIDDENNSDDHFDIANFYTSIIFGFNVSATSSFYVTNKHLRKSLEEFFKLDILLENEFTEERYNKSLFVNLPRLNIKKCFDHLSTNIKKGVNISNSSNNSDILLECIQNTKNICEKYLKDITANPNYIIPEVLFFLEIRDQNVFQLYININDQLRKKDNNNIISRFSRKSENTLSNNFFLSTNCNYFTSHDDYNMKIIIKIINGDYLDYNIKNKNNKQSNKIYYLLIRLTYGECNKFVKKKFEETIFVLQEFNKLLDYNNYINSTSKKGINKNKDNNSKIFQLYSNFLQLYNQLIETSNNPKQSFKLNKNSKIFNYFKKYPDYINKDFDIFDNLMVVMESILNILINYYIDDIPNSNQVIHEYFIDCIDDYWNVDKLKKYLKHDNNLLSLFQNEIKEKTINDIFVLDKNYLYININYKITVFYELCFKITTSSIFIQLDKRYEFEEVKNYIDLMNMELSLGLVWPEKCFLIKDELNDDINNNIHLFRLYYICKYLNKIFNSNKIYATNNWIKIFYDDKSYHDVIQIKFKELKNNKKKNIKVYEKEIIRKNSDESNNFNTSNKNNKLNDDDNYNFIDSFKNEEFNSEEAKNDNKKIIIDDNSPNLNKNNLLINNNDDKFNSSESIESNYSKNSNVKKLFDI